MLLYAEFSERLMQRATYLSDIKHCSFESSQADTQGILINRCLEAYEVEKVAFNNVNKVVDMHLILHNNRMLE